MQDEQEYKLVWESDDPNFLERLGKKQSRDYFLKKNRNLLRICAVILVVVVVLATALQIAYWNKSLLSAMPVPVCMEFLQLKGVTFPNGQTPEYWAEEALEIIGHCEEDPDYKLMVNSFELINFSEDIRIVVNEFYGVTDARPWDGIRE